MRIDNPLERSFYEVECHKQNWSKRELQRQVASSLFERLALSRNKDEIMRLATEGQTVEKPSDILRDPLVLEFVGLKPDSSYSENGLETAIIDKLQFFLLELGKGFLSKPVRNDSLSTKTIFCGSCPLQSPVAMLCTHRPENRQIDASRFGTNANACQLLQPLCQAGFRETYHRNSAMQTENDALVELTLPEDANIYAQQYALCLPEKSLLQQKLLEWIEEYERDGAHVTNK